MMLEARWRAFVAIAFTFVIIVVSTAMSFLVLEQISDEFDVTLGAVSWVVITESLIVAALLLPLGRLADRIGRRRMLATGMAIFGGGCLLTALAPTFGLVIAARIVASFGNALTQAVATGLLVTSFPPEERGLALGAQTSAVAVGSALGPFGTGLLLDVLSWRTLFGLLTIPSAISVALIVALIAKDEPGEAVQAGALDGPIRTRLVWRAPLLSATAITVLTLTINNPFDWSWRSWPVAAGFLVALGAGAAYVRSELRSDDPMLDLRLFGIGAFRTAVLVRWVAFTAATTLTLLMPVLLLSVLEFSTSRAGFVISCMAVGMGIAAQISGRVYDRFGPAVPTFLGLGLQSTVFVTLAFVSADTPWGWIAVASFAQGVAMGLWNVANSSAMLGATPPAALGVGGAFTNVTRTMGNVVGQAMAAAIAVGVLRSQGFDVPLSDVQDTPGAGAAFLDGWRIAFFVSTALTVALGVAVQRLGWRDPDGRPNLGATKL